MADGKPGAAALAVASAALSAAVTGIGWWGGAGLADVFPPMSVLLVLVVLLTSSILVGGVLLPVGGFWLLTELGSRKSKWFAVLSGICVLLSAGWYWVGYEYALTYQSADYFWGVLACSLAVLASAVGLLIGGRSVPWMRIAGCWLFVLWAFTYAFPWMGEYI